MRTCIKHTCLLVPGLRKAFGIFVILVLLSSSFAKAQTTAEYQVKAIFLLNFTRFIEWPATSFTEPNSPFVIGIVGSDPFGSYLDQTVNGESVGEHPIIVNRYKNIKEAENCQIVYIHSNDAEQIKAILPELKEKKVLTVSDASNFASMGGIIGFFLDKNKIRMEINTEAAKAASLVISSRLLNVAKVL